MVPSSTPMLNADKVNTAWHNTNLMLIQVTINTELQCLLDYDHRLQSIAYPNGIELLLSL
jgi:hypothetical protein